MSRLLRILAPLLLLGLAACGDGPDIILEAGPSLLSVGPDSATVAWTTSAPADSFIEWFTDEPAGSIRVICRWKASRYSYWWCSCWASSWS